MLSSTKSKICTVIERLTRQLQSFLFFLKLSSDWNLSNISWYVSVKLVFICLKLYYALMFKFVRTASHTVCHSPDWKMYFYSVRCRTFFFSLTSLIRSTVLNTCKPGRAVTACLEKFYHGTMK